MRALAIFDFDGTITTKDSFIELIKFHSGTLKFLLGMMWLSPILSLYMLKLYPNQKAKERVIRHFFGGMLKESFNRLCSDFVENRMASMINPEALKKIRWHKQEGHDLVVVTASAGEWVGKWSEKYGMATIGSHLEYENERITGKLNGKNCYGDEKVIRLREKFDLTGYEKIVAYGDSKGDYALFEIATEVFYRKY